MKRWYLGCMNDATFIIDAPPRPSTDEVWHERPDGANAISPAIDEKLGQIIVNAHNAEYASLRALLTEAKEALKEIGLYSYENLITKIEKAL